MLDRFKRTLLIVATCLVASAGAALSAPSDAAACGVVPAESFAAQEVARRVSGAEVRDAVVTTNDGKKATVRLLIAKDGRTSELVAKLVQEGYGGWRLVSLAPAAKRKLKSKTT